MRSNRRSYSATVVCEVVVNVSDSWGDDCSMAQIEKQAIDSADGILRHLLHRETDGCGMNAMVESLRKSAIGSVSKSRVVSVTARSREDG